MLACTFGLCLFDWHLSIVGQLVYPGAFSSPPTARCFLVNYGGGRGLVGGLAGRMLQWEEC